jgi:serine/threonine protein kinase
MTHVLALPAGTELVGDYRIERVLGAGGFGITYLAKELALARDVTIKEYFPGDFAARNGSHEAVPRSQESAGDYQWGLERFIAEAQTLAKFDHRNIVRVYRYFRANNTGYMVLQFEEGQSLKTWLQSLGRAPRQFELDRLVAPLLDALALIHGENYLHRDIAPDNIIIRRDGSPVLIDFGSARGDIARQSRTVSALVKPGYSPYEQYAETGSQQGPWTDIYALGATLYHAISGKRPPDAPSRIVKDDLLPAREVALSAYRSSFLASIDNALALDIKKRPQSIAEWRGQLLAPEPRKPSWLQRTIRHSAKKGAEEADKEVPAATESVDAIVPPPPDAPGAKGRLLDHIERLRQKAAAKKAEPALPQPEPAPSAPVKEPQAKPKANALVALPRAIGKVRAAQGLHWRWPKRAKRASRPWRIWPTFQPRWRPLVLKLMIGAAVAAFAVGLQDELTGLPREAGTQTGAVQSIELPRLISGHTGGTRAVAFTEDGRRLVTAGADGTLKVWETANGVEVRTIPLGDSTITALAVSSGRALTGHDDGTLQLWDFVSGQKLGQFSRNQASVWSVAFMGEPDRFLASGHDWIISVWDARAARAPIITIEAHESAVQSVAYSPIGVLASGGADRLVKLWDATSGELVRSYRGHRDFVSAVAFSPDGKYLASGSHDGQVRIWLTSTRRLYRTLAHSAGEIRSLSFSPTGDLLAAASEDGRVRIWNYRRGRLLRSLGEGAAGFRSVAFAPDGRWIAAASDAGAVRLWNTAPLLER